jgi:3D (Asp-Asp-Asp) domain-containing protein
MKSFLLGSAVCVLLVFSVISYARAFTQTQDPKPNSAQQGGQQAQVINQQPGVPSTNQQPVTPPSTGPITTEAPKPETKEPASPAEVSTATSPASLSGTGIEKGGGPAASGPDSNPAQPLPALAMAPQTYAATAYSLRGRTASGKPVSRGLIAADPALLPLGTRVRVEAGFLSGEYLVADTGGAVRGRHIDIWMPTSREARQFGRRTVRVTVLAFGARRGRLHSTHARSRRKR